MEQKYVQGLTLIINRYNLICSVQGGREGSSGCEDMTAMWRRSWLLHAQHPVQQLCDIQCCIPACDIIILFMMHHVVVLWYHHEIMVHIISMISLVWYEEWYHSRTTSMISIGARFQMVGISLEISEDCSRFDCFLLACKVLRWTFTSLIYMGIIYILRRKRCPVILTRTAWVQFLPTPTH